MQKPQVTEIQVRMDCNGCVHKIKKALSRINGIYDLHIDFPRQKITVIGWADQEKIVKAIKKTRKTATICSLTEQVELESPYQPAEPGHAPEGSSLVPDQSQQQPAEAPPEETWPQAEPPEDTPPPPPPGETIPTDNNTSQKSENIPGTKYLEEVQEIHQYSPYYANRFDSGRCHSRTSYSQGLSASMNMPHSYYNTDKPSPSVTEYEYVRSPRHSYHSRVEYYGGDNQSGNANITSILSDENPNACRII